MAGGSFPAGAFERIRSPAERRNHGRGEQCAECVHEQTRQAADSDLKYVVGVMKRTRARKKYEAFIRENREYFSRIPKSEQKGI